MALSPRMVVTRYARRYQPSSIREDTALDKIVLKPIVSENWSSMSVREQRSREGLHEQVVRRLALGHLKKCFSYTRSTR